MQVIIKTDAIERHQRMKEVAKPVALGQLDTMVRQEHVKATDPWYKSRVDTAEAAKNERKFRANLEKVCPETLAPQVKDGMWKRAKQLKDEFVIGMLSKEELHPVRCFTENGATKWVVDEARMHDINSIDREVVWRRKNEAKISEFKNLMRHLSPQDPNAGDIERFRPKRKAV